MKKTLAVVLALILVLSLCPFAGVFAGNDVEISYIRVASWDGDNPSEIEFTNDRTQDSIGIYFNGSAMDDTCEFHGDIEGLTVFVNSATVFMDEMPQEEYVFGGSSSIRVNNALRIYGNVNDCCEAPDAAGLLQFFASVADSYKQIMSVYGDWSTGTGFMHISELHVEEHSRIQVNCILDADFVYLEGAGEIRINAPAGDGDPNGLNVNFFLFSYGGNISSQPGQILEIRDDAVVDGYSLYDTDGSLMEVPEKHGTWDFNYIDGEWIRQDPGPDTNLLDWDYIVGYDDGDGGYITVNGERINPMEKRQFKENEKLEFEFFLPENIEPQLMIEFDNSGSITEIQPSDGRYTFSVVRNGPEPFMLSVWWSQEDLDWDMFDANVLVRCFGNGFVHSSDDYSQYVKRESSKFCFTPGVDAPLLIEPMIDAPFNDFLGIKVNDQFYSAEYLTEHNETPYFRYTDKWGNYDCAAIIVNLGEGDYLELEFYYSEDIPNPPSDLGNNQFRVRYDSNNNASVSVNEVHIDPDQIGNFVEEELMYMELTPPSTGSSDAMPILKINGEMTMPDEMINDVWVVTYYPMTCDPVEIEVWWDYPSYIYSQITDDNIQYGVFGPGCIEIDDHFLGRYANWTKGWIPEGEQAVLDIIPDSFEEGSYLKGMNIRYPEDNLYLTGAQLKSGSGLPGYISYAEADKDHQFDRILITGQRDVWYLIEFEFDVGGGEPEHVTGDFDGDGNITVADALAALRIAAKLVPEDNSSLIIGDVDHDGHVTVADALAILRVAAKLTDHL